MKNRLALRWREHQGTRNALVICPRFFQYPEIIAAELERAGYQVALADDRPGRGTLYKLLLRLFPAAVGAISVDDFSELATALSGARFDLVLVVKGEAITPKAVEKLRAGFPAAHFAYYLWDSVRNVGNAPSIAPLFDTVSTFDREEAQSFGWRYRPLFSAAPAVSPSDTPKKYDWSFVGTIHSDRAKVIRRLRAAMPELSNFVFGYFPSPLIATVHRLKDPAINTDPAGTISLKPMAGDQVRAVLDQSQAILDIEHPRQSGLTMRTIETLLAGRKLITTNRQVAGTALFHPSRVHVIDRHAPVVPKAFFDTPFEPLPRQTAENYSLRIWVEDVSSQPHLNRRF